MTTKQRYTAVLQTFADTMPEADSELVWHNEYELLVAVMLSAQCTDKRVNSVTPALFERYPTVQDMAQTNTSELLKYISSVSYPNSKANHLLQMAQMVVEQFGGTIPTTLDELITLPGVGRKTANVMLVVAYHQAAMPVDTHVFRVAERIGLTTNSRTPQQTELTLTKHIAPNLLGRAHHWLLLHGRYTCTARAPRCQQCSIQAYCRHCQSNNTL